MLYLILQYYTFKYVRMNLEEYILFLVFKLCNYNTFLKCILCYTLYLEMIL